jgi:hypothetical protein
MIRMATTVATLIATKPLAIHWEPLTASSVRDPSLLRS